jgi:VanZ like family
LNPTRKQLLKEWIAAGLWLALIAGESTNHLSAANTTRILYPLFHFFTGVDPFRFVIWDYYIRKMGHFVGYFGLSILLFRAWRATLPFASPSTWSMPWARISFFMTALVASLDEWHQTYLSLRSGSLRDVVLDSSAAMTAQILIFLLLKGHRTSARQLISSNSR